MLKIDDTTLAGGIDAPFRVRYFDNVMDEPLWRFLAETFPTEAEMHSLNAVGLKNSLCDRDEAFSAYLACHPTWATFYAWLKMAFPQICADAFGMPTRIAKRSVRFEFSSLPGVGGEVKPHPDTSKKLATAVMYFDPNWQDVWGGAFEALRHKTEPYADWTDRRPAWDEVETVLSVPVAPCRIGFMLRRPNSLHGVRPLRAPRPRRSITVNLIGRI